MTKTTIPILFSHLPPITAFQSAASTPLFARLGELRPRRFAAGGGGRGIGGVRGGAALAGVASATALAGSIRGVGGRSAMSWPHAPAPLTWAPHRATPRRG